MTIKSDVKIYENNNYKGLQQTELKGILSINSIIDDNYEVSGDIYHYSKVLRDNKPIGFQIDKQTTCNFKLSKNGSVSSSSVLVFPVIQGIPYFPEKDINVQEEYQSNGKIIFDFNNSLNSIQVLAEVKYEGKKEYNSNQYDYFKITLNYKKILESNEIIKANGIHYLSLYFDGEDGKPVFIKDHFYDDFQFKNGNTINRDGFCLYFYKSIIPMNKGIILTEMTTDINKDILKDLDIKEKDKGVSITINNLKFQPDSTELLNSENKKLSELLKIIKKIPNRSVLVIGHTALFGTEEEQIKLSIERAKIIANYLIQNNIPASRVFYEGRGAKELVAPNNSEENMQKNRRVEIIILED